MTWMTKKDYVKDSRSHWHSSHLSKCKQNHDKEPTQPFIQSRLQNEETGLFLQICRKRKTICSTKMTEAVFSWPWHRWSPTQAYLGFTSGKSRSAASHKRNSRKFCIALNALGPNCYLSALIWSQFFDRGLRSDAGKHKGLQSSRRGPIGRRIQPKFVLYSSADALRTACVTERTKAPSSSTPIVASRFNSVNLNDAMLVNLNVKTREPPVNLQIQNLSFVSGKRHFK